MIKAVDGYLETYLGSQGPTRRQDKEIVYARNGAAIYITRVGCLDKFIFGGRILAYEMEPEESIDIDEEADLLLAERYLIDHGNARR
jgi:CMP-N-acetylneuraminic acid synthetase